VELSDSSHLTPLLVSINVVKIPPNEREKKKEAAISFRKALNTPQQTLEKKRKKK